MPISERATPPATRVDAEVLDIGADAGPDCSGEDGIDWAFWERIYGPSARSMPEMCSAEAFNQMQLRVHSLLDRAARI